MLLIYNKLVNHFCLHVSTVFPITSLHIGPAIVFRYKLTKIRITNPYKGVNLSIEKLWHLKQAQIESEVFPLKGASQF